MRFSHTHANIGCVQPAQNGKLTYMVETYTHDKQYSGPTIYFTLEEVEQMYNEMQSLKGKKLEWS